MFISLINELFKNYALRLKFLYFSFIKFAKNYNIKNIFKNSKLNIFYFYLFIFCVLNLLKYLKSNVNIFTLFQFTQLQKIFEIKKNIKINFILLKK